MKQPLFRSFRSLGLTIALAAPILGYAPAVLACACCSEPADRIIGTRIVETFERDQIGRIRFAKPARLAMGPVGDDQLIPGIEDAVTDYHLEVARTENRMTFAFTDKKGRSGTLALSMPDMFEYFYIDPRADKNDKNPLPTLYKEWRLTGDASGGGLFKAAVDGNTQITLVLHGRGNRCTDAEQFGHWTLQVDGPLLDLPFHPLSFFGTLESAGR